MDQHRGVDETRNAARRALWRRPLAERRIAIVLAGLTRRDGRPVGAAGHDIPAGALTVLTAMAAAGYRVEDAPADGPALMALLRPGGAGERRESIALPDYLAFFHSLPEALRAGVSERWGPPERDPLYRPGALSCGGFDLAMIRCGNVALGAPATEGYQPDPASGEPAAVPPHGFLAFYAWIHDGLRADAVAVLGAAADLEWLAAATARHAAAVLGPLPHLPPFCTDDLDAMLAALVATSRDGA